MRGLYVISGNFNHCCLTSRLSLQKTSGLVLKKLKRDTGVYGYVYLNTCNRVEIILDCEIEKVVQYLLMWTQFSQIKDTNSHLNCITNTENSSLYLLTISTGLNSKVIGDDQILGQVKKAFLHAREAGNFSTLIERIFQKIMRCHKEVKNTTSFHKLSVSLAYHTLKKITHRYVDLSTKNLLILGAGDMAQQFVKYLPKFTFNNITIANRSRPKAEILGNKIGAEVVSIYAIENKYDVIISCVEDANPFLSSICPDLYINLSPLKSSSYFSTFNKIELSEIQSELTENQLQKHKEVDGINRIILTHSKDFCEWVQSWNSRKIKRA